VVGYDIKEEEDYVCHVIKYIHGQRVSERAGFDCEYDTQGNEC